MLMKINSILTISAIILSGCAGLTPTQRNGVLTFGAGCSSLGSIVSTELLQMREDVIKMNTYKNILTGKPDLSKREGAFTLEHIMPRVKAADFLENYGDLLKTLIRTGEAREIEKAVSNLMISLKNIPNDNKILNSNDTEMVGRVLTKVAGVWINYKKARTIKKIIPKMAPQVEKLCDLLEEDFDKDGMALATGYDAVSSDVITAADGKRKAENLSIAEMEKYADIYVFADSNQKKMYSAGQKVHSLIKRAKTAQAELQCGVSVTALQ